MQRPSNLIIAFVLAIASVFIAYALSRLVFKAIAPPEIEIEEDRRQSQLYYPENNYQQLSRIEFNYRNTYSSRI